MDDPMTVKLSWREKEALAALLYHERWHEQRELVAYALHERDIRKGRVGKGTLALMVLFGLIECTERDAWQWGRYRLTPRGRMKAEAEEAHGT